MESWIGFKTSRALVRLHFLSVVHVPPPLGSDQGSRDDDVMAQRYAGTEFHSGTSNLTPR